MMFFVPIFWSLFIPFAAVLLWAIVDKVRDDSRAEEAAPADRALPCRGPRHLGSGAQSDPQDLLSTDVCLWPPSQACAGTWKIHRARLP